MLSRSNSTHQEKKITRSNLVEQLREYQIRTKHDWASVSLFTPSSNLYTSRKLKIDIYFTLLQILLLSNIPKEVEEDNGITLVLNDPYITHIGGCGGFCNMGTCDSCIFRVSLYFRQLKLALVLGSVTKHVKLAHKKKRRMLLPLSM
uniref:Uncharacterized protein n=1 Tax=Lactuca sativa TaxID=4236 RepID=A0A9R1XB68_LACSA|nr:hypothetical protein LSAT_V11C500243650 [Lactuca sativa]